jgi:hypothetical protein
MVRIDFRIKEKPPKKIRGKSMWTAESQAGLVRELRKEAFNAKQSSGIEILYGEVTLEINIYVQETNNDPKRPELFIGDLDNLISGICESFQKPYSNYTYISEDPACGKSIFYNDDSQIVSIHALKNVLSNSESAFYRVSIESK